MWQASRHRRRHAPELCWNQGDLSLSRRQGCLFAFVVPTGKCCANRHLLCQPAFVVPTGSERRKLASRFRSAELRSDSRVKSSMNRWLKILLAACPLALGAGACFAADKAAPDLLMTLSDDAPQFCLDDSGPTDFDDSTASNAASAAAILSSHSVPLAPAVLLLPCRVRSHGQPPVRAPPVPALV